VTDTAEVDKVLADARRRMEMAIESLDHDLSGYRTGRASPALVERLVVPYYGSPTPLNQMATIAAPEPRLLTVRVWDQSAVNTVVKAIQSSDLGLTPSRDGTLVRLPIPPLSDERREELIKLASRRVEECRVAIRNIRRDVLHHLEHAELPEDLLHRAKDDVQEMTDEFVGLADVSGEAKAAEIREV
jgi:ribosome recycling factor